MLYQVIHLNEVFPRLQQGSLNPTLTAYLPDNLDEMGWENRRHPCLLICPGGAYRFCSQREAEPVALHFLTEGFGVFVLNYSTAPCRFPAQLQEAAAAMELIHSRADEWHCDPARVAIMGFSAGGHLAAHYSTCFDWPEVRALFPQSKPVQACLLCYPVISADPAVAHMGSFENLLGHTPSAGEVRRFSCNLQVTAQTPPTFLWHTATDASVPVMNSLLYAQALCAHQVPFALHVYPAGRHGLATVDSQTNEPLDTDTAHASDWLDAAKKWLRITFKPQA